MRSRVATRLALALALPAAACTPTGTPDDGPGPAAEEEAPPPVVRRSSVPPPATGPLDSSCGALELEPLGPWVDHGERFAELREGWHPRAEHGRPLAIREAAAPFMLPGFGLWQVHVEHAPWAIQPCLLRHDGVDGEIERHECVPLWMVLDETPAAAQRWTNEQWAQLVGLLDGASAVFPDAVQLDRCVVGLPPQVRASVPVLGLRHTEGKVHATFVERVHAGAELTTLVSVSAVLAEGRLEIERQELWSVDREVVR